MHRLSIRLASLLVFLLFAQFSVAADKQATLDVINAYMSAWNKHDPEAAAQYFAEDGEFLDASVGVPQVGRETAKDKVIKLFIDAVPDLKWQMVGEPVVEGDNIAFEWQFDGRNTGAWGPDTPATNKPLSFKGVSFIRLKDGKIASQHDYYDALGFNKQLGW
ncbi:ester cyclase [Pseudomonas sp. LS1212]|uniref:ester cyclase n=1 Tax=Pseudomonas sp. LS1212 TaxID=2972478 RepID=UPI00215C0197|nr:ester cyclase [Pseudomonas sp. LS1212]UVJ42314.1 ester cyclase [Pseudomonas sp. LS1212]